MAEPVGMTAPLRRRMFPALWIASVASNVGTWMQEVGAAWLMTTLSASPLHVTLIQAGSSVPMFLLAVPSGALADIVDRRRMLLVTQTWMLLAAAVLEGHDVSPTKFSPAPRFDLAHDRGPVMGTVRDAIAEADRVAFTALMREMELVRRRSGAVGWALYEDPAEPELMLEVFIVDSWAEHLRQHERGTRIDAVLRDRIRMLHRGEGPLAVSHLLAVD